MPGRGLPCEFRLFRRYSPHGRDTKPSRAAAGWQSGSAFNAAASAFYAAEGFAPIDRRRRYYRDGSDAVVMERPPRASQWGA